MDFGWPCTRRPGRPARHPVFGDAVGHDLAIMHAQAALTDALVVGVAAGGHRDLGIPVVVALVALVAVVLAFVQVLRFWPGQRRRPVPGSPADGHRPSTARRGRHRR